MSYDARMSIRFATLAAGGVHLLTAGGAVAGLLALAAVAGGRLRPALLWMFLALVIDSVDGPLARRLRVADRLPMIDGRLLDNLVDYLNYVVVPAFLLLAVVPLPAGLAPPVAALVCVVSALQFAQIEAKTHDHFFKGFPSYWNVAAFYLLLLELGAWPNLAIVLVLCVAVFVPIRYLYPNRTPVLRAPTLALCVAWMACMAFLLVRFPHVEPWLVRVSLLFVVYYFALSLWLSLRR